MELKVWVEGIQRIVCGVTDTTTCQDVVFALAHATGKTGRFTLIERWRNNERLLAPSEQPLKVLTKWGERSNDVQFILQWSPLDPKSKSTANNAQLSHLSSSPAPQPQSSHSDSTTNGIKRNNGLVNWPFDKTSDNYPKSTAANNSPVETLYSSSSLSSSLQRNGKLVPVSRSEEQQQQQPQLRPPPYREPPNPIPKPSKELPPYREPPPPILLRNSGGSGPCPSPQSRSSPSSGSVNSSLGEQGISLNESPAGTLRKSGISGTSSINNNSNGFYGISHLRDNSNSSSSTSTTTTTATAASFKDCTKNSEIPSISEMTDNLSLRNNNRSNAPAAVENGDSDEESSPLLNGGSTNNHHSNPNPMYLDLVKLINLQREKLTSQQAELTKYDAEIMFWEGKAKEQQKQMDFIIAEITKLELISSQHESQMLSLSHIEQENELLANEADKLKQELASLKSEFNHREQELIQCKSKIKNLTDEVQSTQIIVTQRDEEKHQRDSIIKTEIERLRKELEIARNEAETVSELSGSLEIEVSTMENVLSEKKKQMEILVNAMKEANLQSLAIQPSSSALTLGEDLSGGGMATTAGALASASGANNTIDNGSHFRLGSQRRMIGSPRQLENAAPTSKNPHGVWV